MRFNAAQQATYAAYLDAWIELANMPSPWERSAEQEAAAVEAGHRVEEALEAHYGACADRQRELDAAGLDAEPDLQPEAEP